MTAEQIIGGLVIQIAQLQEQVQELQKQLATLQPSKTQ